MKLETGRWNETIRALAAVVRNTKNAVAVQFEQRGAIRMKQVKFLAAVVVMIFGSSALAEDPGKEMVLFDGSSTKGWHQAGPGHFDFKDGELTTNGGMGLFWYDKEFGDFILTL